MTLRVGEKYKGLYGSSIVDMKITRIEIHEDGSDWIDYLIYRMPSWLGDWDRQRDSDPAEAFVQRIKLAEEQRERNAKRRFVKEVEVRYR